MNAGLDERYFNWLVGQTKSKNFTPNRYKDLLHALYTTEFVWLVPNDDNRVKDGQYLRHSFMEEQGTTPDTRWMELGCSMLELLIHVCDLLEFISDIPDTEWFGVLIDNLGLTIFDDRMNFTEEEIDEVLNRFIWRKYDASGRGGLFPLNEPYEDQREVEIWYQLNAYLMERM